MMKNKLKINVVVNAPDNPIFLLTMSERYTELEIQPTKGDVLTFVPEEARDFQAMTNELRANSKATCLLEVDKCELNPDMKQLDVYCSLKK